MSRTRKHWHQRAAAQTLLASLTEQDLMVWHARDNMGNLVMVYRPATCHGDQVFSRLRALCHSLPNRMFRKAATDEGRAAVLAWAQRRATVEHALSERFGNPERFRGFRTEDGSATRAFRATFEDKTEWAA